MEVWWIPSFCPNHNTKRQRESILLGEKVNKSLHWVSLKPRKIQEFSANLRLRTNIQYQIVQHDELIAHMDHLRSSLHTFQDYIAL